jgi:hypothetical protein
VGPCQRGGGALLSLSAEWGPALSSEPLVVRGVQREEAPQFGPLKLLLGADPKPAIEGRLGKEEAEGVGLLIQSFGEQEKSGRRADRRQRGDAVEGIFWVG